VVFSVSELKVYGEKAGEYTTPFNVKLYVTPVTVDHEATKEVSNMEVILGTVTAGAVLNVM